MSIRSETQDHIIETATQCGQPGCACRVDALAGAAKFYRAVAEAEEIKCRRLLGDLRDLITLTRRACTMAQISGGSFLERAEAVVAVGGNEPKSVFKEVPAGEA